MLITLAPINCVVRADIEKCNLLLLYLENQNDPVRVRETDGVFVAVFALEAVQSEPGFVRVILKTAQDVLEDSRDNSNIAKYCLFQSELAGYTAKFTVLTAIIIIQHRILLDNRSYNSIITASAVINCLQIMRPAGGKTMQLPEDIGRIVRFHRKQSGLSQAELAISVGVGKTTIYDIERGKNTVRMDKVFKVLTGLNIMLTAESPLMHKMLGQDEEEK